VEALVINKLKLSPLRLMTLRHKCTICY